LECGTGLYSTRLLNVLCKERLLVSADTNGKWMGQFRDLESKRHEFHIVASWETFCNSIESISWGVVLIDQGPAEARVPAIEFMKSKAQFIVVHDANSPVYGYDPVFRKFKYRYDYKIEVLHTTVLSDVKEFSL